MSAQGGIWQPDGKPIATHWSTMLRSSLVAHGPDGTGEHSEPGFLTVYRALHTREDSMRECQPYDFCERYVLSWDGRLDNRDELLKYIRTSPGDDFTDVQLVSEMWLRYGETSLARLVGDWAMALWDRVKRVLYLARDYAGGRPLFYTARPQLVMWNSELGGIAQLECEAFGRRPALDEEFIAGYLALHPEHIRTPFRDLHAVEPGHLVEISPLSIRSRCYWTFNERPRIYYKTDCEYEEHFRLLLFEAVRCRLRSPRIVFTQLSGGLDSSTIACVAKEVLCSGVANQSKLRTISFVFDAARETDEREFIRCIQTATGQQGYEIREDDYPARFPSPAEIPCFYPSVAILLAKLEAAQWAQMDLAGARVLLTGECGDELLGSVEAPAGQLADCLWRGQIGSLHREILRWSVAVKEPYHRLLWRAVAQFLPSSFRASASAGPKLAAWLRPDYVRRMQLRRRTLGLSDPFACRRPSARDMSETLQTACINPAQHLFRPFSPIEPTYPYLHRPLVEFLQAIPPEQILRPGERRSLMRRSLVGILPDKVRNRKTKRDWDGVFFRALARDWSPLKPLLCGRTLIAARGYVDSNQFLQSLQNARHGSEKTTYPLWKAICLELWLRSYEGTMFTRSPVVVNGSSSATDFVSTR